MVGMGMRHLLFAVLLAGTIFGCSSSDPAPTASATEPAATTAALAKCAGCGKEVPKAELAMHDGQMLCKDCIAAHNH
jgi:hypothetical protein